MVDRFARIVALVAVLALASLAGAGTGASPGADFSLVPSSQTVAVGQVFTIDIRVDASSQELDTVQVYIDFDADYLQVVDEDGSPVTGVAYGVLVPGSITATVLTAGLLNRVDNGNGHAGIAYGIPPADGTPVNETFVFATIRFMAMAETGGTSLTFSRTNPRMTGAARGGVEVTGELTGATVTITASGTTPSGGETQAEESSQPDNGVPAPVTITSPADGTITSDPVLVVTGTVSDTGITDATLIVATSTVSRLRSITVIDGYFDEEVTLASGTNAISVSVADAAGNVATARIEVTVGETPAAEDGQETGAASETTTGATVSATAEETPEDKPLTWPIMGGIIGGVLVIGLLVYFMVSRSRL